MTGYSDIHDTPDALRVHISLREMSWWLPPVTVLTYNLNRPVQFLIMSVTCFLSLQKEISSEIGCHLTPLCAGGKV